MSQLSIMSLGLAGLMAGVNMPPLPVSPSGVHFAPFACDNEHRHKQVPTTNPADPMIFISNVLHITARPAVLNHSGREYSRGIGVGTRAAWARSLHPEASAV